MVYTTKTIFHNQFSYRDIESFPGESAFDQLIKDYTVDINTYLGTETNICDANDDDFQSNTIAKVIGVLIEAHLNYLEIIPNKAPTERDQYPVPSLFQEAFIHLRMQLDNIKGADESIEPVAFNVDMTKSEGGFEY